MKIPIEALVLYLKAFAEKTRSGPIDGSTGLRATLSYPFPEQTRTPEGKGSAASKRQSRPETGRGHPDKERRQEERRKQNLPVLLDTRAGRRRQGPDGYPAINFTI